jgi:hypothetical protein
LKPPGKAHRRVRQGRREPCQEVVVGHTATISCGTTDRKSPSHPIAGRCFVPDGKREQRDAVRTCVQHAGGRESRRVRDPTYFIFRSLA